MSNLLWLHQFNELVKKKNLVEEDKKKIVAVIKELEEKKNAALQQAWEQVNRDFGSIFGKLLPGSNAQLAILPGKTVLDGLEVRSIRRRAFCRRYFVFTFFFSFF